MKKLILCFVMLLGYQITPALADQGLTEERLMFRYRLATEAELRHLRIERNLKLKVAVIVTEILPGFPADQKDFSKDDLILTLNGQTVSTYEAIEKFIAKRKPEEEIKISYIDLNVTRQTQSGGGYMELIPEGIKKSLTYNLSAVKPQEVIKPINRSGTSTTSPPVAKPIGINTEFDKFKDLFTIKSQKDFLLIKIKRCPEDFTAFLLAVTKKSTTNLPTISLFITSMNPEWRFLRKPESLNMTVIIDSKDRFDIQCFQRSSDVSKHANCYESMWFNLNEQQLKAFAAATKIEAQLANSEFEFPKEFPAHVKQFVEELQKYVSAPAAP